MSANPASRWSLRLLGLGYLTMLLLIPLVMIFYKTFEDGLAPPIDAITSPDWLRIGFARISDQRSSPSAKR